MSLVCYNTTSKGPTLSRQSKHRPNSLRESSWPKLVFKTKAISCVKANEMAYEVSRELDLVEISKWIDVVIKQQTYKSTNVILVIG